MSDVDEIKRRSIVKGYAKEFGGKTNVRCKVGIAHIVMDDEVIVIGDIEEWESTMGRAKELGICMKLGPAVMLLGIAPTETIDSIDDTCGNQNVTLYLHDGMSLTFMADYFLHTSWDNAKQVAEIIATRHGIGARSNELMKYHREMLNVLTEIESGDQLERKFIK